MTANPELQQNIEILKQQILTYKQRLYEDRAKMNSIIDLAHQLNSGELEPDMPEFLERMHNGSGISLDTLFQTPRNIPAFLGVLHTQYGSTKAHILESSGFVQRAHDRMKDKLYLDTLQMVLLYSRSVVDEIS